MTNKIYAKNIELTPSLELSINKEIEKMNEKLIHDKGTVKTTVTLKVEHGSHICEVVVFMPKPEFIKSTSSEDMYMSIKTSFEKVTREIRKHKEKTADKRHDFIKNISEPMEEDNDDEAI